MEIFRTRDHLLKSDFDNLFHGNELMSKNYYEYFLDCSTKFNQPTINFIAYKSIG